MALDIYGPQGYQSTSVGFTPTLTVPTFDMTQMDELVGTVSDIEGDRIADIEENYANLGKLEDTVLGLDGGTSYGFGLLDEVKSEYGLNTIMNFTDQELKDPFHQRKVQQRLTKAMNDPRMREALMEGKSTEAARESIRKLSRTNADLAIVAKKELNSIISDPNSQRTIFDFSEGDYEKINLDELIQTDLQELMKANPNITFERREDSPDGFVVFDKTTQVGTSLGDFVNEFVMPKYAGDVRVANNWAALQDERKPASERTTNDTQAVESFIRDSGERMYNTFGSPRVIDSVLKEDKIAISAAQTADKIKLKTTLGAGTSSNRSVGSGKGRSAGGGSSSRVTDPATGRISWSKAKTEFAMEPGDERVVLALNKHNIPLDDGLALRIKDGRLTESSIPMIANLLDRGLPVGEDLLDQIEDGEFTELDIAAYANSIQTEKTASEISQSPFFSSPNRKEYQQGGERHAYLTAFLQNPEVQDGIYEDYYKDKVYTPGLEGIEKGGLNKGGKFSSSEGKFSDNQLMYMIHHQGVEGAKHYLETGEISESTLINSGELDPVTKERKASKRDVKKELEDQMAFLQDKDGQDFEVLKEMIESGGEYNLTTKMENSSAAGIHQMLFHEHFDGIKEWIDKNGGPGEYLAPPEPVALDFSSYNNTDEGIVTREVTTNDGKKRIITNDPNLLPQLPESSMTTASKINSDITNNGGTLAEGMIFSNKFANVSRKEFLDVADVGRVAPQAAAQVAATQQPAAGETPKSDVASLFGLSAPAQPAAGETPKSDVAPLFGLSAPAQPAAEATKVPAETPTNDVSTVTETVSPAPSNSSVLEDELSVLQAELDKPVQASDFGSDNEAEAIRRRKLESRIETLDRELRTEYWAELLRARAVNRKLDTEAELVKREKEAVDTIAKDFFSNLVGGFKALPIKNGTSEFIRVEVSDDLKSFRVYNKEDLSTYTTMSKGELDKFIKESEAIPEGFSDNPLFGSKL